MSVLEVIQSECGKIRTRITPNTDTFSRSDPCFQWSEIEYDFCYESHGPPEGNHVIVCGPKQPCDFFFKTRTKTTIVLTPTMAVRLKTNKIKRKQKKMFQN